MLLGPETPAPAADAAIELARVAGFNLFDWQELVLRRMLGEVPDLRPGTPPGSYRWSAAQVALVVPRQNGKTAILEARELVGLFVLGERLIVHSAQELATGLESMRRLASIIDSTPQLRSRLRNVFTSNGKEGIELTTGQRLLYRARSKNSVRGLSPDLLVVDEAYECSEEAQAAQQFATSAQRNPQTVMASSAVDRKRHDNGHVLARLRRAALAGDPAVLLAEWSAGVSLDEALRAEVASSPELWRQSNPTLNRLIDPETVAREQRSMDPRSFAVERLGIGDWPEESGSAEWVIPQAVWESRGDRHAAPQDPVHYSFDVTPDRSWSSISAAGPRAGGGHCVEVVDRRPGTAWVVPRLVDLLGRHENTGATCDGKGPAGSLLPELLDLGVEPHAVSAGEHAQAFGIFVDAITDGTASHLVNSALDDAIAGAAKRSLGEAHAWSRKSSAVDISPLVSCTLALWGSISEHQSSAPMVRRGR